MVKPKKTKGGGTAGAGSKENPTKNASGDQEPDRESTSEHETETKSDWDAKPWLQQSQKKHRHGNRKAGGGNMTFHETCAGLRNVLPEAERGLIYEKRRKQFDEYVLEMKFKGHYVLGVEIERCLKRVCDGLEEFDVLWEEASKPSNANLKDKFDADLKKEVKKLQKFRDQIRAWCDSGELKDTSTLSDARKLIETEMERQRMFEKETRIKTFSATALRKGKAEDPMTKAKSSQRDWFNNIILQLHIQMDQLESDISSSMGKKKSLDMQIQLDKMRSQVDKHCFHIGKLETLLRILENIPVLDADRIQNFIDQVERIKDDLEYYIESGLDADYEHNEFLYEDIDALKNVDVAIVPPTPIIVQEEELQENIPDPKLKETPIPKETRKPPCKPVTENSITHVGNASRIKKHTKSTSFDVSPTINASGSKKHYKSASFDVSPIKKWSPIKTSPIKSVWKVQEVQVQPVRFEDLILEAKEESKKLEEKKSDLMKCLVPVTQTTIESHEEREALDEGSERTLILPTIDEISDGQLELIDELNTCSLASPSSESSDASGQNQQDSDSGLGIPALLHNNAASESKSKKIEESDTASLESPTSSFQTSLESDQEEQACDSNLEFIPAELEKDLLGSLLEEIENFGIDSFESSTLQATVIEADQSTLVADSLNDQNISEEMSPRDISQLIEKPSTGVVENDVFAAQEIPIGLYTELSTSSPQQAKLMFNADLRFVKSLTSSMQKKAFTVLEMSSRMTKQQTSAEKEKLKLIFEAMDLMNLGYMYTVELIKINKLVLLVDTHKVKIAKYNSDTDNEVNILQVKLNETNKIINEVQIMWDEQTKQYNADDPTETIDELRVNIAAFISQNAEEQELMDKQCDNSWLTLCKASIEHESTVEGLLKFLIEQAAFLQFKTEILYSEYKQVEHKYKTL